jgi:hypothetical protein
MSGKLLSSKRSIHKDNLISTIHLKVLKESKDKIHL